MGRASSPSSRSERKTSNLWCPSAIPAWGCPCRRKRSSMRFLLRSFMGPVWDCPSAAPSLNRIAAACGLPTTLRAAQVFTSFYPPKLRHMNDAPNRVCGPDGLGRSAQAGCVRGPSGCLRKALRTNDRFEMYVTLVVERIELCIKIGLEETAACLEALYEVEKRIVEKDDCGEAGVRCENERVANRRL